MTDHKHLFFLLFSIFLVILDFWSSGDILFKKYHMPATFTGKVPMKQTLYQKCTF